MQRASIYAILTLLDIHPNMKFKMICGNCAHSFFTLKIVKIALWLGPVTQIGLVMIYDLQKQLLH